MESCSWTCIKIIVHGRAFMDWLPWNFGDSLFAMDRVSMDSGSMDIESMGPFFR